MNADPAPTYNGEVIPSPVVRHTLEQQLALLNWHPVFTGRCPRCEMPLLQTKPPRVHWDCSCGWMDDSI
ncbi:hypothetical protein D0962_20660 [Leptolyngbyaceae cyanobacterium CCMR0082]|uniref:Uncharacterized protein n=1 Tax=Adonisia turfae CCMR0082 TaxID=2304604 RepID=A0A6M0SA61_9CYAN|nr:hypothetical protein [Adonisia turfae CCMR0082]